MTRSIVELPEERSAVEGDHRCWGCGIEVLKCGSLCVDCGWEEYLASIGHTAEYDAPKAGTPQCCRKTYYNNRDPQGVM